MTYTQLIEGDHHGNPRRNPTSIDNPSSPNHTTRARVTASCSGASRPPSGGEESRAEEEGPGQDEGGGESEEEGCAEEESGKEASRKEEGGETQEVVFSPRRIETFATKARRLKDTKATLSPRVFVSLWYSGKPEQRNDYV